MRDEICEQRISTSNTTNALVARNLINLILIINLTMYNHVA